MANSQQPTETQAPAKLMVWPDLLERPRPKPSQTLAYGEDPLQIVDLWLPDGKGPHPVVLMVHGGCWQTEIADRTIMNWIAEDLRKRGIAVWNIDYRGIDRAGGGYPSTFDDVAKAADLLRTRGPSLGLDISRIVAAGHSAGGHLGLWLAARPKLPQGSPLRRENPLPIHAVISLGGLQDLALAATPPGSGCGVECVAKLVGDGRADPYADTSLPPLLPIKVRQVLVNGNDDKIIPTHFAADYAAKATAAGDPVRVRMVPHTGHVELIAPETAAWKIAVEEIEKALRK